MHLLGAGVVVYVVEGETKFGATKALQEIFNKYPKKKEIARLSRSPAPAAGRRATPFAFNSVPVPPDFMK
ncbi:hypothetical protein EVAR_63013_1 [Eumeta japonica]|uniref:Uncharacterized protein n=1 Tax=Eumeta variegata TaxID=151549 RepID=A0A4C1YRB8_EUMVA|nr:hypothetical protein EVAR_63013_1 [Eumeta japonica]